MKNVFVSKHPLTAHVLSILRNKKTTVSDFRDASHKLSEILLLEATSDFQLKSQTIETPLIQTKGMELDGEVVFIPILRGGLAMLQSALSFFPHALVGMIGLARDEQTAIAKEYYLRIPKLEQKHVILLDPMLATGGSTLHLVRVISDQAFLSLRLVTVIAAPEGIEAVHNEFPKLSLYTAAIDEKLNDQKFIVPGLGDFGDRHFGTE